MDNTNFVELVKTLAVIAEEWPKAVARIDARDAAYDLWLKTFLERQRKQDDTLAQVIAQMKLMEETLTILITKYENLIS